MKNKLTILFCLILSIQFVSLLSRAEDVNSISTKSEIDQMLNAEAAPSARSPASESRASYIEAKVNNSVVRNPIKMNPLKTDDDLEFRKDNSR